MGLASLVPCRLGIRRTEDRTDQGVPSHLFVHSDTGTILRLLYRTSPRDGKLESCTSLAWASTRVAVARSRSTSCIDIVFCRFSSVHLESQPGALALAPGRPNRVIGSNVQLQPVWWPALRRVWLARISASSLATHNAALDRRNMRRRHVGSVACTAVRYKLEQLFTLDIHPNRGRIIATDVVRI